MTESFWSEGVFLRHGWLDADECDEYAEAVREFDRTEGLQLIERHVRGRSLRYKVIDGRRIESAIRDIDVLGTRLQIELTQVCGAQLVPISDFVAARNVNITPPSGEYRWHYDQNAVTGIVYLNEVMGGETEVVPNYRLYFRNGQHRGLQRVLDSVLRPTPIRLCLGRSQLVAPTKGSLLIMRGDRSLHSVRKVHGTEDRINVVLAYDFPGVCQAREPLNRYLYATAGESDANLKGCNVVNDAARSTE
jgi:2OG-Fe(II) oxygenase superfamily